MSINIVTIVSVSLIVTLVPSLNDRYNLIFNYNFGIFIFIVSIFNSFIFHLSYFYMAEKYEIMPIFKFTDHFKMEDRTLKSLIDFYKWSDIRECIEYGMIDKQDLNNVTCFVFALK